MLDSQEPTEIATKSAWARRVRTLVRVLIIAGVTVLLLGLILPILSPFPFDRGRYRGDVKVVTEITYLSQALAMFESMYGEHPPSSIHLYEKAFMWRTDASSCQKIRRLWPQFSFEQDIDLNSDGETDDVHELAGAECLVFFLGGMPKHTNEPIGFSKNPVFPFDLETTKRIGPFMEFDIERLTDVDADGFCEYGDPIRKTPYLYVSRWGNQYRNTDLAIYPPGDVRNMTQVYNRGPSNICDFQIISAGEDGEYGVGGKYPDFDSIPRSSRAAEHDNITSFSSGRLGDF
jgi:hypothetical protein